MLPNLFPLLRDAAAVTAIIGTNPVRFYRHGFAPQGVVAPYVTHRSISLAPLNALSGLPLADAGRQQISCWSDNEGTGSTGVERLARAVRDAIEPRWDVLDIRDMGRDPETGRFRIDLDVQVFNHRPDELPLS
jgi:hypothetical protein